MQQHKECEVVLPVMAGSEDRPWAGVGESVVLDETLDKAYVHQLAKHCPVCTSCGIGSDEIRETNRQGGIREM